MNKNNVYTWVLGSMIFLGIVLFYLNVSGRRILGSNVEKWEPNGKANHK